MKIKHIIEGLNDYDRDFLNRMDIKLIDQYDIGEYSLFLTQAPEMYDGIYQLAINKRNESFATKNNQYNKIVDKGEKFPLHFIKEMGNKIKEWKAIYTPLLVMSANSHKTKIYAKLLGRMGIDYNYNQFIGQEALEII